MPATLRSSSEDLMEVARRLEAMKPKFDHFRWSRHPCGDDFRQAARCTCRIMLGIHRQLDLGDLRDMLRACHSCAAPGFFYGFHTWVRERFGALADSSPPEGEVDKWIWA
jgi:hypothetical protein